MVTVVALLQRLDHLLDQHLGRRGAGRDAETVRLPERDQSMSAARWTSTARWRSPSMRSATSPGAASSTNWARRRPSWRIERSAIAFTASWRLVVA
jgi:hypothetical protein